MLPSLILEGSIRYPKSAAWYAESPLSAGVAPADDTNNVVLSLAKGFRVLEVFTAQDSELTLSQIAAKADLDPGTAFRVVKTLVKLGYLEQVEGAKRYYLSLKVLDLGFHAIARMDLHESARPLLRSLVGQLNEAASIGVLDGAEVVYVERVRAGLARLGVDVRIGSRIPVYCTAIGHSILAWLPEAERVKVLTMRERVRLTPRTPVTIAEIEQRLARVRKQGYALSDQETVAGLRVIAAPMLDVDQHPYGAVSVATTSISSSLDVFVKNSAGPVMRVAAELASLMRIAGAAPGLAQVGSGR